MQKLLKLAWRDIWRNHRRSLLTMGAVFFAVLLISLSQSVETGTYAAMERMVVRLFVSDLQIHRAGFQDNPTLSRSLTEEEYQWDALTEAHPWMTLATRRLSGFGLTSSDSSSAGTMIVGIEPDSERAISRFTRTVVDGQPLEGGDLGTVLLGEVLAKNLGSAVGDSVVLLTQGYRNVMGADLYAVKGLLRMGSPDLDRSMLVMTLSDAQDLFSMYDRFTELVVRTEDFGKAASYADELIADFPEDDYEVMTWRTMMPDLEQLRQLDSAGNYVFYFFLILLVGFEIFNTTLMTMMERVREFGVMMSIGMKPHQISILVALQLFLKMIMALAASVLVTSILVYFLSQNPIPLSAEMMELYEDWGFLVEGISFSANPSIFVFPVVAVATASILSMVYPVVRMHRFSPVGALRST